MMNRTIEAVVFDLGGTLIEYAGAYNSWPELETPGFSAVFTYLQSQNGTGLEFARFRDTGFAILPGRWRAATAGQQNLRLAEFLGEVLLACGVVPPSAEWLQTAGERYQQAVQTHAALIPHAQEVLAQVKTRGYKVGLISNTMFTGAAHQWDLSRFGLASYFDAMLFSADENRWKPNPDTFWHLLEQLGVGAESAVFVGDDPANDVVGGQRAGMKTIHFESSQRFSTPPGVIPHAKIHRLTQLIPLLSTW